MGLRKVVIFSHSKVIKYLEHKKEYYNGYAFQEKFTFVINRISYIKFSD